MTAVRVIEELNRMRTEELNKVGKKTRNSKVLAEAIRFLSNELIG